MYRFWVLMMMLALVGCGASPSNFGDAGDLPDADDGDASDDHKVGFKPDAGSDGDANLAVDASDGSVAQDGGTLGPRRIFETFDEYYIGTGPKHFQGLAGADAACQAKANSANLGGTWKAWLSSSTTSAAQRMTHDGSPYQLVDGTVVAYNWTQLTSGTLAHKIDQDVTGTTWTSAVFWTSTSAGGATLTSTCSDWTSNSASMAVEHGDNDYVDSRWSDFAATTCADHMGLYCVEQ